MATTIEQQVAMDEALVPSTQRLRIGRNNFRLPSDIQSKESTLQLVYDVLRRCSFFKAFSGHGCKKHIVNLESFRDMMHISPRIPCHSFDELPLEEEILEFIRNIDYALLIWEDFVYQVAHKNHKKSNEMYYPRFTKVIIHHFMSKDPSIPRRNKVNWHYVRDDCLFSTIKVVSRHQNTQQYGAMLPIELTNDEIRNTKAYKEYYAFAIGEVVPKPKANARRKRSDSDTSITPPTPKPTAAVTPRLTAAAKGKQPAKATKAKSLFALSEVAMTEAEQLKLVLKRSRQQMHISQSGGSGTDKRTDFKPGVPDVPTDESEEELSWNSFDDEEDADEDKDADDKDNQEVAKFDEKDDAEGGGDDNKESESDEEDDDEETRDEESFDPIPKTSESSEDKTDDEEDQDLNIGEEGHVDEEEEDELYRDVNINQGRGLQVSQDVKDSHVTLTLVYPDGEQDSSSMNETVRVAVQIQTDWLRDSYQRENDEFLRTIDENMKRIIKEQVKGQVKGQVSRILPRIEQFVNAQLEAEVLTRSSHSSRTSYAVAADLSEMELKKILIEKMEGNKSIQRSDEQRNLYKALVEAYEADKIILDTYEETVTLKRRRDDEADKDEGPSAGSDRGSKRQREGKEPESASALLETVTRSAGRVDTLTPELLAGPTYELMKGSCTSLIELEYHLEEIYKATPDQLDWVNPEGQQYPHNLLQPLPLIPDNRCRHVIPFAHFINNDLEYLRGGASSRKYTTSVTKMKATDYENIKWIEYLVPHTMWIQEPIDYDKHALWEVSHWGRKRRQFYGFAVNRESALDVYSKRRIIAVTDLKIVEWHSYKHLDWISVRRDDDKIYKFKESDFKRLRLKDIEDMLLLLVQGKLSNLTVEERFAFNVSLRMFTRSIVIQRRVKDLQLGVESYQKRLNLTKPDTYRSDLKRREAYTAYSNPRGFIYQNKDKKNRLMRIDELYKFSDGTLNDVRTALDDRLKGIKMQYLPQTIWRKGDKDRATAIIQAIDKMLKTRRIMRSLEKFIGERLYEGDFRMLQRTI
nr:hypothetical protein [Tanacetum cinerariifolium]